MVAKIRAGVESAGDIRRRRWIFWAFFLVLGITHGYATVARYDPARAFEGDSGNYEAISEGQPLDQAFHLYRWRILTPMVVGHMDVFLPEVVTHYYHVDAGKVLRFRWGLWNSLGCVLGSVFLMMMMEGLGFSVLQAGVGGLLYATSFQVSVNGAVPLVDPWANAATAACLALALRGHRWNLVWIFAAGMFTKETTVLVIPWIVLLGTPRWRSQLLALLPGLLAYLWFRCVMYPGGGGRHELDSVATQVGIFFQPVHLVYTAVEFALNFLLLAPLAVVGWRESAGMPGLRRMALVLLGLVLIPVVVGCELPRPWFNGFPVFIPLAVLGLWRLGGFQNPAPKPALARARR
jgi:hypothetical protein